MIEHAKANARTRTIGHVDEADVGRLSRLGALWSFFQIAARNVIAIVSTAILARLLSPDDYGLTGMVATLTALLLVFSDLGLSLPTIQRRDLYQAQVINLHWVNIAIGGGLWLICAFVAPFVAKFYGRIELIELTRVMGSTFFLSGLAVQPMALLRRAMRFKLIAKIETLSMLIGAIAGVSAAWLGMGYWALVLQALIGQLIRALMALAYGGGLWHWPRRNTETIQLVHFGGLLSLTGVLIYFARNVDSVLIGRYWGSVELGFYTRAYFLMLLPSTLATGVLANFMIPSLAAFQGNLERFGSAYRRAVRMVAFFGVPMAAGLALVAPEAVRLIYGEKWVTLVPLLVWLSIASITQPIYNTAGWLFTVAGRAGQYFAVTLLNAVVLVTAFWLAVPHGVLAVAQAFGLIMGVALLWPAMAAAHAVAGLRLGDTIRSIAPVFLATFLMATGTWLAGWVASDWKLPWQALLVAKVTAGILVYGLSSLALLRPMIQEDLIPMIPFKFGKGPHDNG